MEGGAALGNRLGRRRPVGAGPPAWWWLGVGYSTPASPRRSLSTPSYLGNLELTDLPQRRQRLGRWLAVSGVYTVILLTLPLAPRLWRPFARRYRELAGWLAVIGLVAIGLLVVAAVWRRRERFRAAVWTGLAAVAAAYAAVLATVELTAAEKLHFLYYGALAWLAYRALRLDLAGGPAYLAACGLVALLGLVDEGVQHLLPNRFFEWKDVLLNALSGGLALAVVALLAPLRRPHG